MDFFRGPVYSFAMENQSARRRTNGRKILLQERKKLKNQIIDNIKLTLNIVHYYLDAYVLNSFQKESIHNDLGASFTSITRTKGKIRKAAHDSGEAKLRDEISWMLLFKGSSFERFFPKIHEYSLEPGNVHYTMQYYNYPNLRRIILSESNAPFFIRLRLHYLLDVLRNELWIEPNSAPVPEDYARAEHFAKYDSRRTQLLEMAPWFSSWLKSPRIRVNGRDLLNAETILNAVRKDPARMATLSPPKLYYSHGDIHTNNILCGVWWGNMVLIDCRGKSSTGTLYFDVAYDIGKIFHDFRSLYSLIERHNYSIFPLAAADAGSPWPTVEYTILDKRGTQNFHQYYEYIRAILEEEFTGYGNLCERADFIEAMLYLTMIPMHLKRKDEALMCWVTGVERLNEWLAAYHPDLKAELEGANP